MRQALEGQQQNYIGTPSLPSKSLILVGIENYDFR